MLPLVCKSFAAACGGPSHLWRTLDIDAEQHVALGAGRLRWARVTRCGPCHRIGLVCLRSAEKVYLQQR